MAKYKGKHSRPSSLQDELIVFFCMFQLMMTLESGEVCHVWFHGYSGMCVHSHPSLVEILIIMRLICWCPFELLNFSHCSEWLLYEDKIEVG